ncbi:unnamed protein product [Tilletia laevis]|uniref:UDP-N-acetylglucosamine transferase subunit ALG13 n=3 Tax=Tilletia TaxID=13289 RepID=A0A8X7MJK6_9BASI|nr:hypothetical protein CF328_g8055 [Tilletia controversa]KAE8184074.1 hypothetical protein CF335_g8132 [Tilletia laevis]KAE8241779.1 hypothetical protein A4X03_0g8087 [Tilletia caries]KAE8186941.1 hypothetical protein CF336_g6775 [Tilletia laevis]KAE8238338.1 hypothetical protein A4X06_0g8847 [Tilletia controversa]
MKASILVTVGSTRFDALVNVVLHPAFLTALQVQEEEDEVDIHIQYGTSHINYSQLNLIPTSHPLSYQYSPSITLHLFPYTPSLTTLIQQATIVISHAGSGTILEVLRAKSSPPLIVVPNHTLMDDHQSELARALGKDGYLLVGRVPDAGVGLEEHALALGRQVHRLLSSIKAQEKTIIKPFPTWSPLNFAQLVDDRLGFNV